MGVTLHLLVALAFIAALTELSLAQLYCSTSTMGDTAGIPVVLPLLWLQAGIRDWQINIPYQPACPYGVGGVLITACDYDRAPQIKVTDMANAYIHRTGNIGYPASVTTTVYCTASSFRHAKHHSLGAVARNVPSWSHNASPIGLIATPH